MAKRCKVARNEQRRVVVERYAQVRLELKRASVDPARAAVEREAAMRALHRLPRDASPTRVRNRDVSDGRPRGYYRKFGLSRVKLREKALAGELPGVTKASW